MNVNKKNIMRIVLFVSVVIAIGVSFFVGKYVREKEYMESREQRCQRLIVFAIDKVENWDLTEDGVLEAFISDIYAAHEFCDNPELAAQLNDLWNSLIYRKEDYIGEEEELEVQLRNILEKMQEE